MATPSPTPSPTPSTSTQVVSEKSTLPAAQPSSLPAATVKAITPLPYTEKPFATANPGGGSGPYPNSTGQSSPFSSIAGGIQPLDTPIAVQKPLIEPPAPAPPTASGAKTDSATGPAQPGAAAGGQRDVSCPNCQGGDFITKIAGRVFSSLCGFIQKTFHIRVEIMQTIIDYVRERVPSSKLTAFDGKCPRCGGSGKISDPSDDTAKYAEAGQIAKGLAPQIEKEEAKLGNGGNRVTLIQSNDYKKVGLVMNNSPSYRVDHDAGYRNKGNAGPDVVNPKYGLQIPEGATANHVQGINPIATPGGQYILECTNRFSVVAGALGVDITTGGPVTIKGGITQIIGPEVTIGSRTGKLALEGDVVNIVGKSVEIAPTDGHMYVRGTISNSGNLMVGGHGHLESASVVKLETVGRNETSKPSAPSNLYGGPAYWGGQSVEAITAAAKELLAYVTSNTTNPEIAKLITTPRYIQGLQDCMKNLLYVSKPEELVQTGYALYLGLQLPVYNFPHIHAIPDQIHVHDTRIPDIDCTADTAQELRSRQAGVNGPAPIGKKSTSIVDVAVSVWSAVGLAFAALWSRFTGNYKT